MGKSIVHDHMCNQRTGADTEVFIGVLGDPATVYAALTAPELEGDSSGVGVIDAVLPVGTTNARGYWTNGEDVENGTVILLLAKGYIGSFDGDLDTHNDRVLDAMPWKRIVDDVTVNTGGPSDHTYTNVELTPNYGGRSTKHQVAHSILSSHSIRCRIEAGPVSELIWHSGDIACPPSSVPACLLWTGRKASRHLVKTVSDTRKQGRKER